MIDHWFGRVLDAMDRLSLWDDTALFLLTDHGHYLGERDGTFGKPLSPVYDLLGGIPVLVSWPGVPAGVRDALTTGVDVHATLTDLFDLEIGHRTHGVSLRRVIEGAADTARDHLLQGYFGREATSSTPTASTSAASRAKTPTSASGQTAGPPCRSAGARSELYDATDTWEQDDLVDSRRADHYTELLRHALAEVEAPEEQLVRLG